MDTGAAPGVELVQHFLKGQNLEQVGRTDEAVDLYEVAIGAHFDSPGPYDRLIHIYSHDHQHRAVIRVADAALEHVHTHADKRAWYERMRAGAESALATVPSASPKRPPPDDG
jgi:hypothetical protein